MANLLADPTYWEDNTGTPPTSWTGAGYVLEPDPSEFRGLYFWNALDTPAGTLSGTVTFGNDGDVAAFLVATADGSMVGAVPLPVGTPTAFSFDLEALGSYEIEFFIGTESGTAQQFYGLSVAIALGDPAPADDTNCDCDCGYPTKTLAQMREEVAIPMGYGAQLFSLPASVIRLIDWHLNNAQRIAAQDIKEINAQRYFTWNVEPGQTKFCTTDNIETCRNVLAATRITEAWIVRDDNQRDRLTKGITFGMAANDNPRSTPSRYDVRSCIEIWPPPDRAMKLVVKGTLAAVDMVADTDTPTVDPTLIISRALAFYKAGKGHQDAQIYMGQYNQFLSGLNKEAFNDYRFNTGHCQREERLTHVMQRRVYDDGSTS